MEHFWEYVCIHLYIYVCVCDYHYNMVDGRNPCTTKRLVPRKEWDFYYPPHVWHLDYGGFHSHGGTTIAWFIMENPVEMDDLAVPLFQETSIFTCNYRDMSYHMMISGNVISVISVLPSI